MAVIDLPPEAPANRRTQLVEALNQQTNIHAVTARHQENRIYISIPNIANPDQAKEILSDGLRTLATHQPDLGISRGFELHHHDSVAYDPNKHRTGWLAKASNFMGDDLGNAGRYSGIAYSIGNVALLTNALFTKNLETKETSFDPDFWKASTAINFILSSTILTLFASQSRDPNSMESVFQELDNKIRNKLEKEQLPPETIEHLTVTAKETRNEVLGMLNKYPWEIAGVLNMAASGSLTISAFSDGRRNWFQGAAGVIGLGSLVVQSLVPPPNGDALFDMRRIFPEDFRQNISHSMEANSILRPFKHVADSIGNTIRKYRLQVSGTLSMVANMSIMVSAIAKHDWRLALTSTTFMLGDFFKFIAPTPPEIHRDDAAFAAATYLANMQMKAAEQGIEPIRASELVPLLEKNHSIVHYGENIEDVQHYNQLLQPLMQQQPSHQNQDRALAQSISQAQQHGNIQARTHEATQLTTIAQNWQEPTNPNLKA